MSSSCRDRERAARRLSNRTAFSAPMSGSVHEWRLVPTHTPATRHVIVRLAEGPRRALRWVLALAHDEFAELQARVGAVRAHETLVTERDARFARALVVVAFGGFDARSETCSHDHASFVRGALAPLVRRARVGVTQIAVGGGNADRHARARFVLRVGGAPNERVAIGAIGSARAAIGITTILATHGSL
jgi:hypothetical protein